MSQEELAVAAHLDRTYISQLERGQKSATLTTISKLANCLGVTVHALMREPRPNSPRVPADYLLRRVDRISVVRRGKRSQIPTGPVFSAINVAHSLIDDLYGADVDVAPILGLRNLSAFVGELFAAAMVSTAGGLLESNPHQDGYPDLLLMDELGKREWMKLGSRMNEKEPFSPFASGGIEIKATCGSIPTPSQCKARGIHRPDIGDTRIQCMTGYDWKAHHRETNNLIGIIWDFVEGRPRIAALQYSNRLEESDWGKIVRPKSGGGRTTSVSIMNRTGIRKMYDGWLCVLTDGRYRAFLNKRNRGSAL